MVIVATINSALGIFVNEFVAAVTARSDLTLSELRGTAGKPASLYKVVPQNDMAAFASATGMLIEMASMELLSRRSVHRTRNLIERAFCRLKDWRRNAIQYDKPVATFASAIAPAVIVLW